MHSLTRWLVLNNLILPPKFNNCARRSHHHHHHHEGQLLAADVCMLHHHTLLPYFHQITNKTTCHLNMPTLRLCCCQLQVEGSSACVCR